MRNIDDVIHFGLAACGWSCQRASLGSRARSLSIHGIHAASDTTRPTTRAGLGAKPTGAHEGEASAGGQGWLRVQSSSRIRRHVNVISRQSTGADGTLGRSWSCGRTRVVCDGGRARKVAQLAIYNVTSAAVEASEGLTYKSALSYLIAIVQEKKYTDQLVLH